MTTPAPEPWYEHHAMAFTQATERLRQAPNPIAPLLADAVGALGDWLIAITTHDVNNARMAWEPQQEVNDHLERTDRRLAVEIAALRKDVSARLEAIERRLSAPVSAAAPADDFIDDPTGYDAGRQ